MAIQILNVTKEFITEGNIRVGKYINGFLPEDAVGSTNKKNGKGRDITLELSGLNQEIKTDIPCDKKIFRLRAPIKEFVRHHKLKRGDNVYLEKIDRRIFRLSPATKQFTFIDLFAGIGGFRIPLQELGGKCVFSCDWDKKSQMTYFKNFGEVPYGDIHDFTGEDITDSELDEKIPGHNVLTAGFPCQPFSRAGVSSRRSLGRNHGFDCYDQGNLFFDIIRIAKIKKPDVLFLENVGHIKNHNKGDTFNVIKNVITNDLNYSFKYMVVDSSTLVPQRRKRCFMVCFKSKNVDFEFPDFDGEPLPLKSILEKRVPDKYTISEKMWEGHKRRTKNNIERGAGFTTYEADIEKPSNTIVARYWKDGKECLIPQKGKTPRMLTPRECARLMGFPESYILHESENAAYKQLGNSVVVPVVRKIAKQIVKHL